MAAPINLRSSHAMLLLVACGQSVLSHTLDDGEHLVTFTSCKLMKAEKNCCQIKKEALAIDFVVKKFYKHLFGRCFSLITDHKLLSILSVKAEVLSAGAIRIQH